MIHLNTYIKNFSQHFNQQNMQPWQFVANAVMIIEDKILKLDDDYTIDNGIAIHKTATIEPHVTLKPPVIIGRNCFVGAHAYMRGGVFLADDVGVGPGSEIKSSFIFDKSNVAHFNFIGDSIIGSYVNFEAGSVTANHYNERVDKTIFILSDTEIIDTGSVKFGSLIGDDSKIGANAVLSPGTILPAGSIVPRLALVEQIKPR